MLTAEHLLAAYAMLDDSGVVRPPELRHPNAQEAHRLLMRRAAMDAAILADVEPADLQAAVLAHLRQPEPWWPRAGQLLALVPARREAAVDEADEAWGKVLTIARVGGRDAGLPSNRHRWSLNSAPWGDPERVTAMWAGIDAAGGWDVICRTEDETTMAAHRAAFRSAYRSSRQRGAILLEVGTVRQIAAVASPQLGAKAPPLLRALVAGVDPEPPEQAALRRRTLAAAGDR